MVSTINDPNALTQEQQDLIVAAMGNRGSFEIATRSDTHGKAVRTKDEKFFHPNDREYARRYIEAVRELEQLLFVRQSGSRDRFELTNFGWLIGRKLQQERRDAGQGE